MVEAMQETNTLHAAAGRGDLAACELLLQQGATVNGLSAEGRTPLHHAVQARSLEVCACLIRAGAQFAFVPEDRNPAYLTPFQFALEQNWREGVRFFLSTQGGDPCAARIWQRG
jgi:ankyrin repeat protein